MAKTKAQVEPSYLSEHHSAQWWDAYFIAQNMIASATGVAEFGESHAANCRKFNIPGVSQVEEAARCMRGIAATIKLLFGQVRMRGTDA